MSETGSVKGTARFICGSDIRSNNYSFKQVEVSVPFIEGEREQETLARLTKEAKRTWIQCYRKQFMRFILEKPSRPSCGAAK